jgi:hypothetical protein
MKKVLVVLGLAALCTSSCASGNIVRVEKPLTTKGVAVSLVDDTCRSRPTHVHDVHTFLDMDLMLQIRNTGLENASFHVGALRLLAGSTSLAPLEGPFAETIRPGSRQWLDVHFVGGDDLRCNDPMTLSFSGALQIETAPRGFGSIALIGRPAQDGWSL